MFNPFKSLIPSRGEASISVPADASQGKLVFSAQAGGHQLASFRLQEVVRTPEGFDLHLVGAAPLLGTDMEVVCHLSSEAREIFSELTQA